MSASSAGLPRRFASVDELESFLAVPSPALVAEMKEIEGDLVILGVAGKMGPTLARLAKNATPSRRVIGVARFSEPEVQERLDAWGVETIACDLLDRDAISGLPDAPNLIFAAGHKFGASGNTPLTWAMNTWVPSVVAERYRASRIVAFSTGNVYPLTKDRHARADRDQPDSGRSATTPSRASAASGCSSTSRRAIARRAGSSASTTRSTCATACCSTSPRR